MWGIFFGGEILFGYDICLGNGLMGSYKFECERIICSYFFEIICCLEFVKVFVDVEEFDFVIFRDYVFGGVVF